ncbi:hypothetical protein HMPREF1982_01341 [Clostridiales bacterium oral taxon 876 str. F0540]|nr:hypothetical protein HMPREF1982_01341 [Clostridiales bacterium oral taxon 876 str. F0540]
MLNKQYLRKHFNIYYNNDFSKLGWIMDELKIIIINLLNKIKLFIFKIYDKLLFMFNKQATLQRMYKPILENKQNKIETLKEELNLIKKENEAKNKKLLDLSKENNILNSKIALIQNILLKK